MTRTFQNKQHGAVLVVALVMLLVLTMLTISSMKNTTLETRVTASRADTQRLMDTAEAAIRQGEFSLYGVGKLRAKLEHTASNCMIGSSSPCVMVDIDPQKDPNDPNSDPADEKIKMLMDLYVNPLTFFLNSSYSDYTNKYQIRTGKDAISGKTLAWIPYKGLGSNANYKSDKNYNSYWNVYLLDGGADDSSSINVEYGAIGEGRGTFFYLVNGQSNDELAVQSTTANIYLGLNN